MSPSLAAVESLLERVRACDTVPFYKEHWGGVREFSSLPPLSRGVLAETPLSRRRYGEGKALVKIVRAPEGSFASEWRFEDIAKEDWGPVGVRPMIYLSDPDEALEKSMWCYEHNVLPLIGEALPEMAQSAAAFYDIDSLVTDAASLQKLAPYLAGRARPLRYLVVIGSSFDAQALMAYAGAAEQALLVLSLPETGAYAQAALAAKPVFTALQGCVLEATRQGTLLTKTAFLSTPIIRYVLPESTPAITAL